MKAIYLFSLPRAGSTLVQRVLAQHPHVATTSEPWLLLPLLASLKEDVMLTQYNQQICSRALHEYIEGMPLGMHSFLENVRDFATSTYANYTTDEHRYFLDKTPRYHLIANEIMEAFKEDGRYILLWRNPLAITASIVETFAGGAWNLFRWKFDLYEGILNLLDLQRKYGDRLCVVQYEDLISGSDATWRRLFHYLDLEFDPSVLGHLSRVQMDGMGDPTGQKQYKEISSDPLGKWKQTFTNPVRKRWGNRYLDWLGGERLIDMGYDISGLREELNDIHLDGASMLNDVGYSLRDLLWSMIEPDALRLKLKRVRLRKRNYTWS